MHDRTTSASPSLLGYSPSSARLNSSTLFLAGSRRRPHHDFFLVRYRRSQTLARSTPLGLNSSHIKMGDVSQVPSPDVVGHAHTPKSKKNAHPSPSYIEDFPERPDQPECQYYLKTGSCKYGSTCKYHHPKDRISSATSVLGPLGLPLRPGHAVCTFYSKYGTCRFGSACRFDHPLISYYNYTLPEISAPNQRNPPVTLTSPKTMKSEVRDEALPSDSDEYRTPPALSSESLLNQSI